MRTCTPPGPGGGAAALSCSPGACMAEDCPKSISALMHVAVAMCGTGGAARKRRLPRRFTNHSTAKVLSTRACAVPCLRRPRPHATRWRRPRHRQRSKNPEAGHGTVLCTDVSAAHPNNAGDRAHEQWPATTPCASHFSRQGAPTECGWHRNTWFTAAGLRCSDISHRCSHTDLTGVHQRRRGCLGPGAWLAGTHGGHAWLVGTQLHCWTCSIGLALLHMQTPIALPPLRLASYLFQGI